MSESSDTGQTSIVFLGRESFRMQVVGGDAIPGAFREGPTEKIIERRNWDRRYGERRRPRRAEDVPALATGSISRKKLVIGVSLATFVFGVLAATAFDRFRPRAHAERMPHVDRAQPVAVTPAVSQPAAPVAPAIAVAPIVMPEPATPPAPAASAPTAAELHAQKRLAQLTAHPAAPVAHPARPKRPAAPARAIAAKPAAPAPSTAPRPTKKWVDPFAD